VRCSHCGREGSVNDFCACPGCRGRLYHKSCWPRARFHLPVDGPGYVCKQPTDFMEYVWINYVIHSQTTPEEQAVLHRVDMWSSWFSVPNQQERAKLHVYPRLQWLISDAQALRDDSEALEQFPSLVSFFGETG